MPLGGMEAAIPAALSSLAGSAGAGAAGAGAAAGTGAMGTMMQGLQALQGINQLAGPQGGLVTGDPGQIAGGIQGIQGGLGPLIGMAPAGALGALGGSQGGPPTTQSLMGLSREQFGQIPPEIQQQLLRKLMGR